jgi:hypothetical protein
MSNLVEDFNTYRSQMNEKIMASDNLIIKRIFNLDTNAYQEGALSVEVKEMLGLACSMVLRCDDCVKCPNSRNFFNCYFDWRNNCGATPAPRRRILGGTGRIIFACQTLARKPKRIKNVINNQQISKLKHLQINKEWNIRIKSNKK